MHRVDNALYRDSALRMIHPIYYTWPSNRSISVLPYSAQDGGSEFDIDSRARHAWVFSAPMYEY